MRTLHLTQDQFEVLYDLLDYKVSEIESECTVTGLTLDDYDIYQVWQNLNRLEGKS